MSDQDRDNPRREFLRKSLTLIPVVTVASTGLGSSMLAAAPEAVAPARPASAKLPSASLSYEPSYFSAEEWAFIKAAVERLIPADEMGPGALEAGVPEYIDRQMNTPYAAGALWYMQGPFKADAAPEMGWQSKLVPKDIYRLGIAAVDAWCKDLKGQVFAAQDSATRDALLKQLEAGTPQFEAVPAKLFFNLLLQNTKEGFFSDPIHGGNKGLVGWTLIGFPGARADFMDWVERNEQYPFPAVSIRGERA
ncbi:gluconate 2-dehydrogenase subunit 3 family protein [Pseudomonas sp. TKO26]|uniref:gluconate 2-dehydrogenase subunit 3 family protein n=1 Tax=Pseudomonas TaxID=286 RepID=UPI000D8FA255|nr:MULTISPECIES: gluconate 2-dehydrogenase subunit 3 family protein [Pseudomonas]PYY86320.1 gluconate 2-dehydrogenase subunit 3 family protein [Pseudomonas sp. TKO30]PYY89071.1 gluconate 2-dehydrogenase subunit 3 family protein [Pseudomonas sp. TKO29]PYY91744.1 gluconate 2-dehydrogenase subunit 3 family protein [Pseudomonas sp. TKO26]PYY99853.1 gluconate 2-dehydrogenase subunit 3 family protein [Pseudomonas sp. TKO14]